MIKINDYPLVNRVMKRRGVRQFFKFSIVGVGNFILDATGYSLLRSLKVIPELAKALSFILAATSSYYFNRRWTFRSHDQHIARQYLKFLTVASVGLAINTGSFTVFLRYLSLPETFSFIGAAAAAVMWNFLVNKFWTFRPAGPSAVDRR